MQMLLTSLSVHGVSLKSLLCIRVSCVSSVSISRPPSLLSCVAPLFKVSAVLVWSHSLPCLVCLFFSIDLQCSGMHVLSTSLSIHGVSFKVTDVSQELCVIRISQPPPCLPFVCCLLVLCLLCSCGLTLSLSLFPILMYPLQCSTMHMLLTSLSVHGVSLKSSICVIVSCVSSGYSIDLSGLPRVSLVCCPLVQGVCCARVVSLSPLSLLCVYSPILIYSVR